MFALCVLGFGWEGSDHFVFNELDLLSHLGHIGGLGLFGGKEIFWDAGALH